MKTPAAPVPPPPPPLGLPAAPAAPAAAPAPVPPTGSAEYHQQQRRIAKRKRETLEERHDGLQTEVARLKMRRILLESDNAGIRQDNGTSQPGDAALIDRGHIAHGLLQDGKPEVLVLRMMSDVDASKTLMGDGSAQALLTGTLAVHASKRAKTAKTPKAPAVRPPHPPPPQPAATDKEATPPPPPPPQPAAMAQEQRQAQHEQLEAQAALDFISEQEFDAFDEEFDQMLPEGTGLYELSGTPLITPLPTPFGTPQAPARVRPALDSQPSSPSKMARFLVMG